MKHNGNGNSNGNRPEERDKPGNRKSKAIRRGNMWSKAIGGRQVRQSNRKDSRQGKEIVQTKEGRQHVQY